MSDEDADRLFAREAAAGDVNLADVVRFLDEFDGAYPEISTKALEAAHVSAMIEAAHLLADKGEPVARVPGKVERPGALASSHPWLGARVMSRVASMPLGAKAATVVAILLVLFASLGVAGKLPTAVQHAVAGAGDAVGLALPDPVSDWQAVTLEKGLPGSPADGAIPAAPQFMASQIVAGESGLVAVGWFERGAANAATAWTSTDGVSWKRIPHSASLEGSRMDGVASWERGFVAWGTRCDYATDPEGPSGWGNSAERVAAWTSPDGVTWSRVPDDAFGPPSIKDPSDDPGMGKPGIDDIVAGGPGLVAVGAAPVTETKGPAVDVSARPVTAVWTSLDGVRWMRSSVDSPKTSGTMRAYVLEDMRLAMVAEEQGPSGTVAGRTWWVSSDGAAWARTTTPTPDPSAVHINPKGVGAKVYVKGGSVVYGSVYDEGLGGAVPLRQAAVWIAVWDHPNTWQQVLLGQQVTRDVLDNWKTNEEAFDALINTHVTSVLVSGGRLVAVGFQVGATGDSPSMMIWTSEDGRNWTVSKPAAFTDAWELGSYFGMGGVEYRTEAPTSVAWDKGIVVLAERRVEEPFADTRFDLGIIVGPPGGE